MSSSWNAKDWLKSFGLEQYYMCFIENGYETQRLCANLKKQDLDGMGIKSNIHRGILLNHSASLRATMPDIGSESPGRYSSGGESPRLPAHSPRKLSNTSNSLVSTITDTELYTTVFDDTKKKKGTSLTSLPAKPQKRTDIVKQPKGATSVGRSPALRFMGNTQPKLTHSSSSSSSSSQQMTKLQLKLHIKEMLSRDQISLSDMKYNNEDGGANESALIQIAEMYADELNLEALNVYDALKDVWRYVTNEKNDFVLPKSNNLVPSIVAAFSASDQRPNAYWEIPDDVNVSPVAQVKKVNNITSTTSMQSAISNYSAPFDALSTPNPPVIVKSSPAKTKLSQTKTLSSTTSVTNEIKNESSKTLPLSGAAPPPCSPSLSHNSTSSDEAVNDKSPSRVKRWNPFYKSERKHVQNGVPLPGLNEQKSGSAENLKLKKQLSRQSLPVNDFKLPRSISTNPAQLYQQSLVEDKKKLGGSLQSLSDIQPSLQLLSEDMVSLQVKRKSLEIVETKGNQDNEIEIRRIFVDEEKEGAPSHYVDITDDVASDGIKEEKKKSSLLRRLFKKTKKINASNQALNKQSIEEKEEIEERRNSRLTNSTSLPDINAAAKTDLYEEVFDIPTKTSLQQSPPRLPSRNRPHSARPHRKELSVASEPPVPRDNSLESPPPDNVIINQISSQQSEDPDEIIELHVPTYDNFIPVDTKSIRAGQPHYGTLLSPNRLTEQFHDDKGNQFNPVEEDDVYDKLYRGNFKMETSPNMYDDPWKPLAIRSKQKLRKLNSSAEEQKKQPVVVNPRMCSSVSHMPEDSNESLSPSPSHTIENQKSPKFSPGKVKRRSPLPVDVFENDEELKVNPEVNGGMLQGGSSEKPKDMTDNGEKQEKGRRKLNHYLSDNLLQVAVEKMLNNEGIDLTTPPYSSQRGEYGIPSHLVSRYSEEIGSSEENITKALDKIRRSLLLKARHGHIPLKKNWKKYSDVQKGSLKEFLISIGMPQYHDTLVESGYSSVSVLKKSTLSSLTIDEGHLKRLNEFVKKL